LRSDTKMMRGGFCSLGAFAFATTVQASYVSPQQLRSAHGLARSRMDAPLMTGTCVVTDGTDSFYGSRKIFQALHDYCDFDRLVAYSTSIVDAKKMCISRQARYSGLIDVLDFAEGDNSELASTLGGTSTWVCVNADEAALPSQLAAAQSAGVDRVFIHLTGSPADAAALESAAGSLDYTLMVTGKLGKGGGGGGLILGEPSAAKDGVPIDDAFRVLVEGLTIPEASKRSLSLNMASDGSQLKEMRMAGCTRREECEALFKGQIKERTPDEIEAAKGNSGKAGAASVVEEVDERSDEEKRLAQEEEVKALLEKARVRGEENQKRMAAEEALKKAEREERLEYMRANMPPEPEDNKKDDDQKDGDDDKKDGDDKKGDDEGKDDGKGDGKGDGGDDKKDQDGGDDDGLALA